jgi:hypothetical protein
LDIPVLSHALVRASYRQHNRFSDLGRDLFTCWGWGLTASKDGEGGWGFSSGHEHQLKVLLDIPRHRIELRDQNPKLLAQRTFRMLMDTSNPCYQVVSCLKAEDHKIR